MIASNIWKISLFCGMVFLAARILSAELAPDHAYVLLDDLEILAGWVPAELRGTHHDTIVKELPKCEFREMNGFFVEPELNSEAATIKGNLRLKIGYGIEVQLDQITINKKILPADFFLFGSTEGTNPNPVAWTIERNEAERFTRLRNVSARGGSLTMLDEMQTKQGIIVRRFVCFVCFVAMIYLVFRVFRNARLKALRREDSCSIEADNTHHSDSSLS